MLTVILLGVVLIVYIILLIAQHKNRDNLKIDIATQVAQGLLWIIIAIDNWNDVHLIMRVAYVIVILLLLMKIVESIRNRNS